MGIVRKRVDFSIQTEQGHVEERRPNLNEVNRLKSLQVINKKMTEEEVQEIIFQANCDSDESEGDIEGASESNQHNNVSDGELKKGHDQSKYILPQSKLKKNENFKYDKEAKLGRAESKRDKKESNEELKQSGEKRRRDNDDAGNILSELWLEEYDYLIEVYRKQEETEMNDVNKESSSKTESVCSPYQVETELERLYKERDNIIFEWYQSHKGMTNKRKEVTEDKNNTRVEEAQKDVKEDNHAYEVCEDIKETKSSFENYQNCRHTDKSTEIPEKDFVTIDTQAKYTSEEIKRNYWDGTEDNKIKKMKPKLTNKEDDRNFQEVDNENSKNNKESNENKEINENEDIIINNDINEEEEEGNEDEEEKDNEEKE